MDEKNNVDVTEKQTNDEFAKDIKNKGAWKVVLVVLVILLLLVGGFAYYFYFYANTNRYIDKISNKLTNYLAKEFNFDLDGTDMDLKGDLEITNLGKINFDGQLSTIKNQVNITLGNELTNVTLYKDGNNLFMEDQDIYDGILQIPVNEEMPEEMFKINYNGIKNTILGYVKYGFEALKEGNNTTKIKSLTEKQYIIKLDKEAAALANTKFQKLVNEDQDILDFFDVSSVGEIELFSEFEITITVNPFNNKIKEITYKDSENLMELKQEEKNKYILTDGQTNNPVEIYIYDDGLKIVENYDDVDFQLSSTIKSFDLSAAAEGYIFDLNIENIDDQESKFNLNFKGVEEDINWNINGTINVISKTETEISLNSEITSGTENVNFKVNLTSKIGNDLVKKVDYTKVKNIEDLTEEEQFTILSKLASLLENFNLTEGTM